MAAEFFEVVDQIVEFTLEVDLRRAAQGRAVHAFLRGDVREDRFDDAEPLAGGGAVSITIVAPRYRALNAVSTTRVFTSTSSATTAPAASRTHAWCFRSPKSNPIVDVFAFIKRSLPRLPRLGYAFSFLLVRHLRFHCQVGKRKRLTS